MSESSLWVILCTFETFICESELKLLASENRLLDGSAGTGLVSFEAKMNLWCNFKVRTKLLKWCSFCCMAYFGNFFGMLPLLQMQ
ncbi:hypothetical protein ACE6H2_006607 [Prunus campanulata]